MPRADLLAAAAALSACASSFEPAPGPEPIVPQAPPVGEPAGDELSIRQTVLETALGQLGRPYRYGGGDGDGFDCSGLVKHVFAEVGITLPRTAIEQSRAGREIAFDNALSGDLVFFRIKGGIHSAIYVGAGRAVHAPSAGKDVRVTSVVTPYWKERFHSAVRVLP